MTKQRVLKEVPKFKTEAEERRFWETHDTSDYVNWDAAHEASFPNLKPTTTTISLRLPSTLLSDLKILANKDDVPYQSLLKVLLAESIAKRRGRRTVVSNSRMHLTRPRQ
jgi:predicted DNA binding CopG/RHH family protein